MVVFPSYNQYKFHAPHQSVTPSQWEDSSDIRYIYISTHFQGWQTQDITWNRDFMQGMLDSVSAKTNGIVIYNNVSYEAIFGTGYSGYNSKKLLFIDPTNQGYTAIGGFASYTVSITSVLADYTNGNVIYKTTC